MKEKMNLKGRTLVLFILTFILGGAIGGAISYGTLVIPEIHSAQKEKSKFESLKKQADSDSKESSKVLKEANDYYRKINGLKNNAGEQVLTKIYQTAEVGKDIAPGYWSVKGEGSYTIFNENGDDMGNFYLYDDEDSKHIQLNIGYYLQGDIGDYSTWTPDK
ncbi:hypothetical protein [Lactococcus petauri]|uniref:hypothetical protein n=1 Tax=Lactococcus petauri TaxID=1940789 RepID=UPI00254D4D3F|nr:hypothetical protein [Lactococcus petauri]